MKNRFHKTLACVGAALLVAACGGGGNDTSTKVSFNALVSFGDSISDVGNPKVGTVAGLAASTGGGGRWTVNTPAGLPFTHALNGAGAIQRVGKIGEVRSLPITAIVQYRFLEPGARFRPYVGAGPTYAKFYKAMSTNTLTALTGGTPATPTTLSIDSRLGLSIVAGGVFSINDRWFVDATIVKTYLKTRTTLSTSQTLDIKLDPVTVSFGLGYRF